MKKAEKEKAGRKRDAKEVARRSTLINTDNIFIKLSESLLAPTPNPLAPPRSKPKRSPSRPASKQSPHKLSRSHLQPSKIHTDKSQLDMKGGADLGKSLNRSNVLGGEKVEAAGRSSAGGVSLRLDLSKFQHRKLAMSPPQGRLSREAFHWECVIGRGGYGRVWRVEVKKTQMHFAAKQMSKALILAKKNISSIINEKQLLQRMRHPFIANLQFAFQDKEHLYLGLDLLEGGDLRRHIAHRKTFKEHEAKFIIACLILALQYVHAQKVIHRDVKPENLIFDRKGYLRLSDFGIAKPGDGSNRGDSSGTPVYMAPEVLCKQGHSYGADYYAVGIITYELMLGRRPYNGVNRSEIKEQVLSKQFQLKPEDVPQGWNKEAADFVNRLIIRKDTQRLGALKGMEELKTHAWFQQFNWGSLKSKTLKAPITPLFDPDPLLQQPLPSPPLPDDQETQLLIRKQEVEGLFADFYFELKKEKTEKEKKTSEKKEPKDDRPSEIKKPSRQRP